MKCCRGPYSAKESCSEGAALHAAPVQPLASSWQSFASAPAPSNKGLSRSWLFPSLPKLPARRQRRGAVRVKPLPVLNSPLISLCRRKYFGVSSILSRKHCMAKATQSNSYPTGQQVIDPTGGENLSYQEHEWKLGTVEGLFSLGFFFPPPETASFLLPQRFFFKPTRTSCVDLQGQMISWDILVLIKPNLSWQDRAARTAIRFSAATLSSTVMSKLCNLGFDRLWGFSQWFLTSLLVPLTFQWPQYEH